jgi:hypothetical protein
MLIGWNMDSGAYAFNQRASWESTDFESLFNRRAGISSQEEQGYQGAETVSLEASYALMPELQGNDASFRATSLINGSVDTAIAVSAGVAADIQAPGLDANPHAVIANLTSSSSVVLEDRDVSLPSDASIDSNALPNLEHPTDESPIQSERATVSVKGSDVQVWIRNATIPASSMSDISGLLKTELSWRGLVLSSLKINGKSLMAVTKMDAARGLAVTEGGIQEGQRILEGNGHGG